MQKVVSCRTVAIAISGARVISGTFDGTMACLTCLMKYASKNAYCHYSRAPAI